MEFRIKKGHIGVTVFMALFFVFYLFLLWRPAQMSDGALILNQPDEVINAHMISSLVSSDHPGNVRALNEIAFDQIHPRSTTVIDHAIVPIGFPGMIVIIAFLTTILTFFTGSFFSLPLAAAMWIPLAGVLSARLLFVSLRPFVGQKIALYSAFSLLCIAPWWYYASRSFQHNTLFVFFLLAAIAWFVSARRAHSFLGGMIFALLVGTAIYIRPAELVWVCYGILASFCIRKKIGKVYLSGFLFGGFLMATVFFTTQYFFYGHALGTGYAIPDGGESGLITGSLQGRTLFQSLVFPFGFDIVAIIKHSYWYLIRLVPLWSVFVFMGSLRALFAKERDQVEIFMRRYLFWVAPAVMYILAVYGSWSFFDNLAGVVSLASSHVRYFLPIYLAGIPLAVYGWSALQQYPNVFVRSLALALVPLFLIQNISTVFLSFEGLLHVREVTHVYEDIHYDILNETEDSAIIVTRYSDKYLFPSRDIIPGFTHPLRVEAAQGLVQSGIPLYYLDLIDATSYLEESRAFLEEKGLLIGEPLWQNGELELRRISAY